MADLKNPRIIFLKGFLFLLTGIVSATLLLLFAPSLRIGILLAISIWCFCRFYYFAFYVIEHYVDDQFRYAGLFDFLKYAVRNRFARKSGSNAATPSRSEEEGS